MSITFFLSVILMIFLHLDRLMVRSHSMSEIYNSLEAAICQKLDPLKLQDDKFQFAIESCQFSGSYSNSRLQGFSRCYVNSMKNTSTSITINMTHPQILWKGNATMMLKNCKFAKDSTTINYYFDDLWSCANMLINIQLQKKGDDDYTVNQVTADINLDKGVTKMYSTTPKANSAVVAQTASLVNRDNNYINEQFNPFKKPLGQMVAAKIKKNLPP